MTDYSSTSARAARGALLLDEALPGWSAHVSPSRIDMDSPTDCVLAQLTRNDPRVHERMARMMHPALAEASHGTYRNAALAVFGGWPLADRLWEYGFHGSVWVAVRKVQVNLLDGAWFAEVARRTNGSPEEVARNVDAALSA